MFFLCIVLVYLTSAYFYLTYNFSYWSKRNVPAANAKILLGNLPNIILQRKHILYDFEKIYKDFKGKTPFVGIIQVRKPRLVVFEPELVKDVLIRNFSSFHDNQFSDMFDSESNPLFARNPFLLQGEEWKEMRTELTPGFTINRLKVMYPLIEDVQVNMISYLKKQLETQEQIEARELCAKYATDVVSNAIFGVDAQSFTKEKPEIREMGKRLITTSGVFVMKMLLVSAVPIMKKIISTRFVAFEVEEFFINLMNQALTYREKNNVQREDFLDYLIQVRKKKGMEDIHMASHTILFFADGFDMSSAAMSHVLYELANNKHVQDKLRVEINKHCDEEGKIDFETLIAMPYLDQVWYETLRMHLPQSYMGRVCSEDITLEFNHQKAPVEKGIIVYIPLHQIHNDPEYYPEPELFKPERFDEENGGIKAFKDRGVFFPFGDGPRACIGKRFVSCQSKAAVVAIIRNFEISVNEKTAKKLIVDPKEFLNIKVGGLWLDFKPIQN